MCDERREVFRREQGLLPRPVHVIRRHPVHHHRHARVRVTIVRDLNTVLAPF